LKTPVYVINTLTTQTHCRMKTYDDVTGSVRLSSVLEVVLLLEEEEVVKTVSYRDVY